MYFLHHSLILVISIVLSTLQEKDTLTTLQSTDEITQNLQGSTPTSKENFQDDNKMTEDHYAPPTNIYAQQTSLETLINDHNRKQFSPFISKTYANIPNEYWKIRWLQFHGKDNDGRDLTGYYSQKPMDKYPMTLISDKLSDNSAETKSSNELSHNIFTNEDGKCTYDCQKLPNEYNLKLRDIMETQNNCEITNPNAYSQYHQMAVCHHGAQSRPWRSIRQSETPAIVGNGNVLAADQMPMLVNSIPTNKSNNMTVQTQNKQTTLVEQLGNKEDELLYNAPVTSNAGVFTVSSTANMAADNALSASFSSHQFQNMFMPVLEAPSSNLTYVTLTPDIALLQQFPDFSAEWLDNEPVEAVQPPPNLLTEVKSENGIGENRISPKQLIDTQDISYLTEIKYANDIEQNGFTPVQLPDIQVSLTGIQYADDFEQNRLSPEPMLNSKNKTYPKGVQSSYDLENNRFRNFQNKLYPTEKTLDVIKPSIFPIVQSIATQGNISNTGVESADIFSTVHQPSTFGGIFPSSNYETYGSYFYDNNKEIKHPKDEEDEAKLNFTQAFNQKPEHLAVRKEVNFFRHTTHMSYASTDTTPRQSKNQIDSTEVEMLSDIMQELEDLKMDRSNSFIREGLPCHMDGSWVSEVCRICMEVSVCSDGKMKIRVEDCVPPKSSPMFSKCWTFTGEAPFPNTGMFIINGMHRESKRLASFIGQCRVCGGSDMVTGVWLIGREARDCRDTYLTVTQHRDVFHRTMLHCNMEQKFSHMRSTKSYRSQSNYKSDTSHSSSSSTAYHSSPATPISSLTFHSFPKPFENSTFSLNPEDLPSLVHSHSSANAEAVDLFTLPDSSFTPISRTHTDFPKITNVDNSATRQETARDASFGFLSFLSGPSRYTASVTPYDFLPKLSTSLEIDSVTSLNSLPFNELPQPNIACLEPARESPHVRSTPFLSVADFPPASEHSQLPVAFLETASIHSFNSPPNNMPVYPSVPPETGSDKSFDFPSLAAHFPENASITTFDVPPFSDSLHSSTNSPKTFDSLSLSANIASIDTPPFCDSPPLHTDTSLKISHATTFDSPLLTASSSQTTLTDSPQPPVAPPETHSGNSFFFWPFFASSYLSTVAPKINATVSSTSSASHKKRDTDWQCKKPIP